MVLYELVIDKKNIFKYAGFIGGSSFMTPKEVVKEPKTLKISMLLVLGKYKDA